jgi:hypothetical protein
MLIDQPIRQRLVKRLEPIPVHQFAVAQGFNFGDGPMERQSEPVEENALWL